MSKPLAFTDKTGNALMSNADASAAMASGVAAVQKPASSTAASAAIAERSATVSLSRKMTAAPTLSAADEMKRKADAPSASPTTSSQQAPTRTPQSAKNVAAAADTAQQQVDRMHADRGGSR